jgi:hypothetical protein
MKARKVIANVHLYCRPENADVVKSLCEEGAIDKALEAYVSAEPGCTEMEVWVEPDPTAIGWNIRVRGVETPSAVM